MTDELLIAKYQKSGDVAALDQVIDRYLERAYRFFRGVIPQQSDVDDIVQNLFLKMIRRVNTGEPISHFQAYFYTSCRNIFRDFLRSKSAKPDTIAKDDPDALAYVDLVAVAFWEACGGQNFISDERIDAAIEASLTGFTDRERKILSDYLNGYSLEEIGKRNQCAVNTAASIWRRKKFILFDDVMKRIDELEGGAQ